MNTKNQFVFSAVQVLFWVVFIGLSIKVGAVMISFVVSLFVNPEGAKNIYLGLNLSELLNYGRWYYISMMTLIIAVMLIKAHMASLVIKLLSKLNLQQPFDSTISKIISRISEIALIAGIIAIITNGYAKWIMKKLEDVPDLSQYLEGGGEFFFLAAIIYVIALIYKKGVALQSENELTV